MSYSNSRMSLNLGRTLIDLKVWQVLLIVALAMSYLVVASLGIDMFSKCDELEGNDIQEYLNKWLVATLAIAITIPVTLLFVKFAGSKSTGILTLFFGVLGIVGSSAVLHWSEKCDAHKDDESKKTYGGVNLALYIGMLFIGILLLTLSNRRGKKVL